MPRKKLIEVALSLEATNAASAREKSIRHGHSSTLHLWRHAASVRQDVDVLRALRLHTVSTADLLTPAFELAHQFDLTAYDAGFAALAQQLLDFGLILERMFMVASTNRILGG